MTYVYDDLASEIKRKATQEEIELVERHHKRKTNLYNDYNRILAEGKREIIGIDKMNKLWKEYITELRLYNDLFNKYMGYCYWQINQNQL